LPLYGPSPHPDDFKFPGFQVALASASLPGMTMEFLPRTLVPNTLKPQPDLSFRAEGEIFFVVTDLSPLEMASMGH
jgi:hypothetical protein